MDILRILSAPDLEVRKKTLNLALELLTSRTVSESVMFLRKEVGRTHNSVEHDDTGKYRQLLVRTLHQCCVKVMNNFINYLITVFAVPSLYHVFNKLFGVHIPFVVSRCCPKYNSSTGRVPVGY